PDASWIIVGIRVSRVGFLRPRQWAGLPNITIACIYQDIVMIFGEVPSGVLRRKHFLPDHARYEVLFTENLRADFSQIVHLVIVNADKDDAILAEQVPRQV